ncbi:hypothetical protein E5161_00375 [Cohnella pontilimi]|uniref:HEAT repeat domain-containing protein n=1 Tax=Cohnella pontilimi TaxID=2564100 RepID=A0A4U0FGB5_9BACL|nr:hypothetical protein [Cohnella pontilimi]TJY43900.1 hypothetical protein E5161_00375 [Cohnella pontilimi]
MPTERTRNFIEEFIDDEEQRLILVASCNAFDRLETKLTIEPSELQPIVNAAKNKHKAVWQIGGDFLWRLSINHEEARNVIRTLIHSRYVDERFQIMACIRKDVPVSFSKEIIREGIADTKGKRVREKAAQAFFDLNIKELVPDFEIALDKEQNEETKESIRMHLHLIRDGYYLKKYRENHLTLFFPNKEEWGGISICGISVKPEEISNEKMIKETINKRRR